MNKKETGAAVRRGILTGTLAGFVAGWLAFAGYAKKFDEAEVQAAEDVRDRAAQLVLPAVPGLPQVGPLPTPQAYRVVSGPNRPMPRIVVPGRGAVNQSVPPSGVPGVVTVPAPSSPPVVIAPVPTFAPLPALPPAPPVPKPTTKTS